MLLLSMSSCHIISFMVWSTAFLNYSSLPKKKKLLPSFIYYQKNARTDESLWLNPMMNLGWSIYCCLSIVILIIILEQSVYRRESGFCELQRLAMSEPCTILHYAIPPAKACNRAIDEQGCGWNLQPIKATEKLSWNVALSSIRYLKSSALHSASPSSSPPLLC